MRPVLVMNGQFPGPLIEVNEGDRVLVNVTNQLQNGTSMHWHGFYQNGTNWMDGTSGITQVSVISRYRK
jgi:FtsP/CotA-like multicopper oxidase with cupredoxin domain